MVTVPVLTVASGLKGSNLPSGFSGSASSFLSGGFDVPGAASKGTDAVIPINASTPTRNMDPLSIAVSFPQVWVLSSLATRDIHRLTQTIITVTTVMVMVAS